MPRFYFDERGRPAASPADPLPAPSNARNDEPTRPAPAMRTFQANRAAARVDAINRRDDEQETARHFHAIQHEMLVLELQRQTREDAEHSEHVDRLMAQGVARDRLLESFRAQLANEDAEAPPRKGLHLVKFGLGSPAVTIPARDPRPDACKAARICAGKRALLSDAEHCGCGACADDVARARAMLEVGIEP